MSASIRFLGVAILAYVGLRTASSALALEPLTPLAAALPAAEAPAAASLPPMVPADMGPLPPEAYAQAYGYPPPGPLGPWPAMVPPVPRPMLLPYPVLAALPASVAASFSPGGAGPWTPPPPALPGPETALPDELAGSGYEGGETPPLEQWPAIGTAGPFSVGGLQQTPAWGKGAGDGPIAAARQSRWSMDLWALARQPRSGLLSYDDPADGLNPGLASGGSLGGSQAGMRLTWRPLPRVGLHLRASTALLPQGRRGQTLAGGEGSVGVSYQPIAGLPVRVLAERRQRMGPALGGGRNAFAFLVEGGVSDREIAHGIRLDGYGQAGVVGARSRDLFADGALTATYPIMPRIAFGAGMWGGIQPGLSRFDAGPRLSYQMSPLLRMHLDYRFRALGRADPPSGPALTLSGGF